MAGHKVVPDGTGYSATKHAVRVISEGLRQAVKPYNIRATIISPAAVATELPNTITDADVAQRVRKLFQIVPEHIRPRVRGSHLRVETRRNGEIAACFEDCYVPIVECRPAPKTAAQTAVPEMSKKSAASHKPVKSKWMKDFWNRPSPSLKKAIRISNATS